MSGMLFVTLLCCRLLRYVLTMVDSKTRGAQTAYSRHTCRYHHNSGNQAHPKIHSFRQYYYKASYFYQISRNNNR